MGERVGGNASLLNKMWPCLTLPDYVLAIFEGPREMQVMMFMTVGLLNLGKWLEIGSGKT